MQGRPGQPPTLRQVASFRKLSQRRRMPVLTPATKREAMLLLERLRRGV
jgi:hypothetical protein